MRGATARDPEVGKAARLAANSLGPAISATLEATLDEISQELRDQPGKSHNGDRSRPGATAPPNDATKS